MTEEDSRNLRLMQLEERLTAIFNQMTLPSYGSIALIVHDGKIVQIDRYEVYHQSSVKE